MSRNPCFLAMVTNLEVPGGLYQSEEVLAAETSVSVSVTGVSKRLVDVLLPYLSHPATLQGVLKMFQSLSRLKFA
jgi:hypothetical protein